MDDLSQLTSNELRKRLQDAGLPSGPITKTTRKIFETKLAKYMKKKDGPGIENEPNTTVDAAPRKVTTLTEYGSEESGGAGERVKLPDVATKPAASSSGIFFGICIPALEHDDPDSQAPVHVYEDRNEVMKVLKMNQGARFKAFKTKEEARKFSSSSQEMMLSTSMPVNSCQITAEKSNNYKSPKTIDLVRLMKAIQQDDMTSFRHLVWSNPRYLISSADTPVILMGGPRYNALHIAAKHNVADMCSEILNIMQNDRFLSLVFENDSPTVREERSSFLIDLYLNTPDKGQCDTPLHFASKFGHIDVVEVLVQHPLCDRGIRNKYTHTPRNVICERCDISKLQALKQTWSRDIGNIEILKSKIESLLDDNFYVPVFRSEGNTMQAVLGEPWSPDFGERVTLYPQRHASPISPSLQVKAFAGPMSPQRAHDFHSSWKSPSESEKRFQLEIRRTDDEKGLERIGRHLSQNMAVPWSEYWGFLGKFADFSTDEGLQMLDNYLQNRAIGYNSSDNDDLIGKLDSLSLEENVTGGFKKVADDHNNLSAYGDTSTVESANTSQNITPSTNQHVDEIDCLKEEIPSTRDKENDKLTITTPNRLNDYSGVKTTPLSNQKILLPISVSSQEKFLKRSQHHAKMLQRKNNSKIQQDLIKETNNVASGSSKINSSGNEINSSGNEINSSGNEINSSGNEINSCDNQISSSNGKMNSNSNNINGSGNKISNINLHQDQSRLIEPYRNTPCKPGHDSMDIEGSCIDHNADLSTPQTRHRSHPFTFIQGFEPSKLDMNVYLALEHVCIPSIYPHIIGFKHLVESYSVSDRKSWKTPIRLKRDGLSWQENVSSPMIGGKTDHIPHSLSPTFHRRTLSSTGNGRHQDINKKLFVNSS